MMFHAKALELLSECYQNLEEMYEEDDLQVIFISNLFWAM